MANNTYILTHPNGEDQPDEYTMTEAEAIKVMKGKSMSKKWKFKDKNLKIVPKSKGKGFVIESPK